MNSCRRHVKIASILLGDSGNQEQNPGNFGQDDAAGTGDLKDSKFDCLPSNLPFSAMEKSLFIVCGLPKIGKELATFPSKFISSPSLVPLDLLPFESESHSLAGTSSTSSLSLSTTLDLKLLTGKPNGWSLKFVQFSLFEITKGSVL